MTGDADCPHAPSWPSPSALCWAYHFPSSAQSGGVATYPALHGLLSWRELLSLGLGRLFLLCKWGCGRAVVMGVVQGSGGGCV